MILIKRLFKVTLVIAAFSMMVALSTSEAGRVLSPAEMMLLKGGDECSEGYECTGEISCSSFGVGSCDWTPFGCATNDCNDLVCPISTRKCQFTLPPTEWICVQGDKLMAVHGCQEYCPWSNCAACLTEEQPGSINCTLQDCWYD